MADMDQLERALRNADAAGDTEAARTIAQAIRSQQQQPAEPFAAKLGRQVLNAGAGALRGAGSIGATLLTPLDAGARALGIQNDFIGRTDRRQAMDQALQRLGADTGSLAFGAGKLGAEVAGTLGVGGGLANVARAVPGIAKAAPGLLDALSTGGMAGGGNLATRAVGGGIGGAASAGLVDPNDAAVGGAVGAALPPALRGVAAAGRGIGASLGSRVAPEVQQLAQRAGQLGVDIPADRLVNSRPLNALTSALNYVPFSGRQATETAMNEQLNRAASRLIGQDTPNINQAIRAAGKDLGAKFDATLKNTGVQFDQQLLSDIATVHNTAQKELGSDSLRRISSQVDELLQKGQSGVIDGQAAYNIKRTLDRIGAGNTPEAFHATELKKVLMDGLNRSLGPDGAKAFAQTRQQYGNMLALEKLAKNGVEGELSVARLANMRNINNQPLQELADIAAQFVKPREAQHGAMQRAVVGLGAGSVGGLPGIAAMAGAGRAVNATLNSDLLRSLMLSQPRQASGGLLSILGNPEFQMLGARAAPVLAGDQ